MLKEIELKEQWQIEDKQQYTRGNVGKIDDYFHIIIPEGIYLRNKLGTRC